MNKLALIILIVATTFLFSKCSRDVNPMYKDLIGSWKIDSTRLHVHRIFKNRSQALTLNKDSTFTLTFSEGDIIDIQKGRFNLIMKPGLELPILTLRSDVGDVDSLIIVSIDPTNFCASQETKLRSETGELKVYSLAKYFSKDK